MTETGRTPTDPCICDDLGDECPSCAWNRQIVESGGMCDE